MLGTRMMMTRMLSIPMSMGRMFSICMVLGNQSIVARWNEEVTYIVWRVARVNIEGEVRYMEVSLVLFLPVQIGCF